MRCSEAAASTVRVSHARTVQEGEDSRRRVCAAICPHASVSLHRVCVCVCMGSVHRRSRCVFARVRARVRISMVFV